MKPRIIQKLIVGVAMSLMPCMSFAAIVYDNTANQITSGGTQVFRAGVDGVAFGDQVSLLSGTDRILTEFDFYYYFE